jgi:hypothetical protein
MIPCFVCGLAGFIQLDGGRLGCVIYRRGLKRCLKLPHQDGTVACENGGNHCKRERKRKCGFFHLNLQKSNAQKVAQSAVRSKGAQVKVLLHKPQWGLIS